MIGLSKSESAQTLRGEWIRQRSIRRSDFRFFLDVRQIAVCLLACGCIGSLHAQIDPLAEEYPVPGFLLHPLIENAIKYGMNANSKKLIIDVKAEVVGETLHLEITNTGKWKKAANDNDFSSTGTGIRNVRERLQKIYPNNHLMDIVKGDDRVSVKLQLKKELAAINGTHA